MILQQRQMLSFRATLRPAQLPAFVFKFSASSCVALAKTEGIKTRKICASRNSLMGRLALPMRPMAETWRCISTAPNTDADQTRALVICRSSQCAFHGCPQAWILTRQFCKMVGAWCEVKLVISKILFPFQYLHPFRCKNHGRSYPRIWIHMASNSYSRFSRSIRLRFNFTASKVYMISYTYNTRCIYVCVYMHTHVYIYT